MKLTATENRTVVTRSWGAGGMGSYCGMGTVLVGGHEKVLEMDVEVGCKIM